MPAASVLLVPKLGGHGVPVSLARVRSARASTGCVVRGLPHPSIGRPSMPAVTATRPVFRFAPSPNGAPASRPRLFGAAEPAAGARAPAASCCCAWRTSTASAAGRPSRPRSRRIWPGSGFAWASPGAAPVRALRPTTRPRSNGSTGSGSSIRAFARAATSHGGRGAAPAGRAIPTARRSIPEPAAASIAGRARGAARGRPSRRRCGSTWPRRSRLQAGPARLAGISRGRRGRAMAADPAAWGDALLARKDMPTSYHLAVVVDDAAQGVTDVVRGEDLLRGHQPAPPAAGSCSGSRRPPTTTIG